ncbi:hypothetical protein BTVI_85842 [Pitangus sulphuratus]|nr:hypothetical protein BTVI_85842 [Pitangus sulphuratus]
MLSVPCKELCGSTSPCWIVYISFVEELQSSDETEVTELLLVMTLNDTKKKQNKLEEVCPLLSISRFLIYIDCDKEVLDYMLSYYLLSKYFLQCPATPSWLCHRNGDALVNYVTEISYIDAYLLAIHSLPLYRLKLITAATELLWSTPG